MVTNWHWIDFLSFFQRSVEFGERILQYKMENVLTKKKRRKNRLIESEISNLIQPFWIANGREDEKKFKLTVFLFCRKWSIFNLKRCSALCGRTLWRTFTPFFLFLFFSFVKLPLNFCCGSSVIHILQYTYHFAIEQFEEWMFQKRLV